MNRQQIMQQRGIVAREVRAVLRGLEQQQAQEIIAALPTMQRELVQRLITEPYSARMDDPQAKKVSLKQQEMQEAFELLEGLETNPAQTIEKIIDLREAIIHHLKEKKLWRARRTFENINLQALLQHYTSQGQGQLVATQLQAAKSKEQIQQLVESNKLISQKWQQFTHREELLAHITRVVQVLQAFDKEYQQGNAPTIAEEFVKTLAYIRDQLPQELEQRYGSKQSARFLQEKFKSLKDSVPIIAPKDILPFVQELMAILQNPQEIERELQAAKQELGEGLQSTKSEKQARKEMKKLQKALKVYLGSFEEFAVQLDGAFSQSSDIDGQVRQYLSLVAATEAVYARLYNQVGEGTQGPVVDIAQIRQGFIQAEELGKQRKAILGNIIKQVKRLLAKEEALAA